MSARIDSLLPSRWNIENGVSKILIQVHRVARPDPHQFGRIGGFSIFDASVAIVQGSIEYDVVVGQNAYIGDDGRLYVKHGHLERLSTPEGHYLIFMTPLRVTGDTTHDGESLERIKTASGYLICLFGRNMVFSLEFEQTYDLTTKMTTISGPLMYSPMSFPPPLLSDLNIATLHDANRSIGSLDVVQREKLRLSLRWMTEALTTDGLDGFLKAWFAIETISMPSTNIRTLNETLARLYQITLDEASKKFMMGRIVGLRSNIVHNGFVCALDSSLINYLFHVFCDLVSDVVRTNFEARAAHFLALENFELDKVLSVSGLNAVT